MANLEVVVGLVDHKGIPDVTYDIGNYAMVGLKRKQ